MIKRKSPPPASKANRNVKDKKYQRHGSLSELIQRSMVVNGKSFIVIIICATALMLSVYFIPPLKLKVMLLQTPTSSKQQQTLQIPPCPNSPWKTKENLQGNCPGIQPYKDATTISQCASSCCANEECITWQFRQDTGCIQGTDIRLGMEKDGPAAWCSDHPPHRWKGQYLKPHGDKNKGKDEKEVREGACSEETWNPDEEIGQCFGLGAVRSDASGSAEDCMKACCNDENCGAWQWNKELGCFYGGGMHGCQGGGDPIKFEPFVGRRKQLESRKYTDGHGKPWQMAMP